MTVMKIPYFDGAEMEVDGSGDGRDAPLADAEGIAALDAFLSLTAADRLSDSRHVHAYYRDVRKWIGGEDWMDQEMGVPDSPEAIWRYIAPTSVSVIREHRGGGRWHVVLEAGCGWDREHGLMMVWRDGRTLCKVGGYDGHLTNASGRGGELPEDVVYDGLDGKFRTYRDR